ncbi:hypothetical protein DNTS_032708, partial [Danionella cerebrum]
AVSSGTVQVHTTKPNPLYSSSLEDSFHTKQKEIHEPPEVFQFYKVTKFYKKREKEQSRLSGGYDQSVLVITGGFVVVISNRLLDFHFAGNIAAPLRFHLLCIPREWAESGERAERWDESRQGDVEDLQPRDLCRGALRRRTRCQHLHAKSGIQRLQSGLVCTKRLKSCHLAQRETRQDTADWLLHHQRLGWRRLWMRRGVGDGAAGLSVDYAQSWYSQLHGSGLNGNEGRVRSESGRNQLDAPYRYHAVWRTKGLLRVQREVAEEMSCTSILVECSCSRKVSLQRIRREPWVSEAGVGKEVKEVMLGPGLEQHAEMDICLTRDTGLVIAVRWVRADGHLSEQRAGSCVSLRSREVLRTRRHGRRRRQPRLSLAVLLVFLLPIVIFIVWTFGVISIGVLGRKETIPWTVRQNLEMLIMLLPLDEDKTPEAGDIYILRRYTEECRRMFWISSWIPHSFAIMILKMKTLLCIDDDDDDDDDDWKTKPNQRPGLAQGSMPEANRTLLEPNPGQNH